VRGVVMGLGIVPRCRCQSSDVGKYMRMRAIPLHAVTVVGGGFTTAEDGEAEYECRWIAAEDSDSDTEVLLKSQGTSLTCKCTQRQTSTMW